MKDIKTMMHIINPIHVITFIYDLDLPLLLENKHKSTVY